MKEKCETCEWRSSEIGYASRCPAHEIKSMSSLKQFQEEGEKKFKAKGVEEFLPYDGVIYVDLEYALNFNRQQTTLAYELGKKEMLEKLTPRIGMLRQWLNEERITDKKMVTSEDIKDWLGLSALNEE